MSDNDQASVHESSESTPITDAMSVDSHGSAQEEGAILADVIAGGEPVPAHETNGDASDATGPDILEDHEYLDDYGVHIGGAYDRIRAVGYMHPQVLEMMARRLVPLGLDMATATETVMIIRTYHGLRTAFPEWSVHEVLNRIAFIVADRSQITEEEAMEHIRKAFENRPSEWQA